MTKENIEQVKALLESGMFPLFKLKVRKGKDSRLIRVTDTDSNRFYGVFVDTVQEGTVIISHDSIKHGTFILESLEST